MMKTLAPLIAVYVFFSNQVVFADFVNGYAVTYQCGKFEYKVSVPDNGCDDLSECGDPTDAYTYFVRQGKKHRELKAVKGTPLAYKNQNIYFDGDQLFLDKDLKRLCKKLSTSSL